MANLQILTNRINSDFENVILDNDVSEDDGITDVILYNNELFLTVNQTSRFYEITGKFLSSATSIINSNYFDKEIYSITCNFIFIQKNECNGYNYTSYEDEINSFVYMTIFNSIEAYRLSLVGEKVNSYLITSEENKFDSFYQTTEELIINSYIITNEENEINSYLYSSEEFEITSYIALNGF
ncbi:MAG: hypothetical protein KC589_07280, partial [Nanoarchaeota archaeon]|nr:hypothetical protein [Nanoarchaeota archaeon]